MIQEVTERTTEKKKEKCDNVQKIKATREENGKTVKEDPSSRAFDTS